MTRPQLLLVDFDDTFREACADLLTRQGYQVFLANTLKAACELLEKHWIAMAIINVQMHDPENPEDSSGLALLRHEKYRSIPKFAIANFPNHRIVREVLRPDQSGKPLAVDFLEKEPDIGFILTPLQNVRRQHLLDTLGD